MIFRDLLTILVSIYNYCVCFFLNIITPHSCLWIAKNDYQSNPDFQRIFGPQKSQFINDIKSFSLPKKKDDVKLYNRLFHEALYYKGNEGVLSNKGILRGLIQGTIEIEPFHLHALAMNSYDITLGIYYYRKRPNRSEIYNIYSEKAVQDLWELKEAELYSDYVNRTHKKLDGFKDTDKLIWLYPHELILGHTSEKLGARRNHTTKMFARSSTGRSGIQVCSCSGLGDPGFSNIWTMEIKNNTNKNIPLLVGRRIAQIQFLLITDTFDEPGFNSYEETGKYKSGNTSKDSIWEPFAMLPKLYKDIDQ